MDIPVTDWIPRMERRRILCRALDVGPVTAIEELAHQHVAEAPEDSICPRLLILDWPPTLQPWSDG